MHKTSDILLRIIALDLSEDQKTIFIQFCDENLKKEAGTVTYADMWNYASTKHIREINHDNKHFEIMKIMWERFMKEDPCHSKVFYRLIRREEARNMTEGFYKILVEKNLV